jgi:hypothetical protein
MAPAMQSDVAGRTDTDPRANNPVAGQGMGNVNACVNCGGEIPGHRVRRTKGAAKWCDPSCANEYRKKLYAGQNTIWNIASGTVGAINELRVSVDLLVKGYAVFRALSPACPCDLVVLYDGRVFRVEVTTGHRSVGGNIQYPKKDNTRYDVLAVVVQDAIVYSTDVPELRHLTSA